jgi:hypothetical protein
MKDGLARRIGPLAQVKPDLTDAAANLVGVIMRRLAERLERAAEFENIAIAIFPVVEEGKIAADRVKTCQRGVLRARIGSLYIGTRALYARARAESGAGFGLPAAPRRRQIGGARRIG